MSTASTMIISNLKNATAPTSNTAKAASAAGMDVAGMMSLAQTKALELKSHLTLLVHVTDAADGNLATLNNILASLT